MIREIQKDYLRLFIGYIYMRFLLKLFLLNFLIISSSFAMEKGEEDTVRIGLILMS